MTNPTSFRLPASLEGKADPQVVEAIGWHDDAINDLQQAVPSLKAQIDAIKATAAAASGTTNVSTASQTTVIVQGSAVGAVNNQTGFTSYATQQSDYGGLVILDDASAIAVTLTTGPAIQVPWFCFFANDGAGTATLTPQSGTINGSGSLALATNYGAICFFDGTNFWAVVTIPTSGSGYTPLGGSTGSRPGSPIMFSVYYDTTLVQPVWWDGSNWRNSAGVIT